MAFNEISFKQVKLHPCLYNKKIKVFKNGIIKHQAWIAVGNELKESGKLVTKKNLMSNIPVVLCKLIDSPQKSTTTLFFRFVFNSKPQQLFSMRNMATSIRVE